MNDDLLTIYTSSGQNVLQTRPAISLCIYGCMALYGWNNIWFHFRNATLQSLFSLHWVRETHWKVVETWSILAKSCFAWWLVDGGGGHVVSKWLQYRLEVGLSSYSIRVVRQEHMLDDVITTRPQRIWVHRHRPTDRPTDRPSQSLPLERIEIKSIPSSHEDSKWNREQRAKRLDDIIYCGLMMHNVDESVFSSNAFARWNRNSQAIERGRT